MKILILYFSAVGATKTIAKMMKSSLSAYDVKVYNVEKQDTLDFSYYDALIVGTPTHHAEPAKFLVNYIEKIPVQNKQIPTFVFNTKGLAAGGTNRILAKKLLVKNFITIYEADYIAPASDGSLLAPQIKRFFTFEKEISQKVARDCTNFLERVQSNDEIVAHMPPFRFRNIINAPNKFGSQFFKMSIHLHQNACIKCDLCINRCPYQAFEKDEDGFPVVIKEKCTNCFRCIHKCPKQALSLFKHRKPTKVIRS